MYVNQTALVNFSGSDNKITRKVPLVTNNTIQGCTLTYGISGDLRRDSKDSIYIAVSGSKSFDKWADSLFCITAKRTITISDTLRGYMPYQPHRIYPIEHKEQLLTRNVGFKQYELTDHLGNVRVVVGDVKAQGTLLQDAARILAYNNFYTFGINMPGRTFNSNVYRYGFNGKEKDDEISGSGNSYDYGFRIYNPRIGRFLSVDPLTSSFPWWTPYQFAGNTPIWATDLDGLETWYTNDEKLSEFSGPLDPEYVAKMGLGSEKPNPASSTASGTGGFRPVLKVQTAKTVHNSSQLSGSFAKFLPTVLKHEGGYVNDPDDPGGATNKGITFNTFKANANLLGVEPTLDNLKNLTNEQAGIIYQQKYWNKIKGDDISDAQVAYQYVDFYINAGNNAVKVMQQTLKDLGQDVTVDGKMGKQTVNAINNVDPEKLHDKFKENRIQYYENLADKKSSIKKFLKGWTNRANSFEYKKNGT